MKIFAIPVEDKFILYRPLLQRAFVGNRAMADLALNAARQESADATGPPQEAMTFLQTVGFLEPDPPPPPPPERSYCPSTAVLLLTNRCNLRCTYCYASGGEGAIQDLSPAVARTAIDQAHHNARERGRSRFELTFHGGGEPLQAWEILQGAVAYARGKDLPCHVSMVSNGVWNARQREWIIHNLDGLTISFDGRSETQNQQRPLVSGRGSFQAVMHTINALDEARFPYGIRMTATAPWREQFPQDVRFICQETGCQVMQVEPAFNVRRGEHQGPALEESLAFTQAFMEGFEIARRAGRQLTYSGARPWLLAQAFCTAPYNALIVNASGTLVTCYEIASAAHALADMSTIGHIVNSQVLVNQQARNAMLAHLDENRDKCKECFCQWHCAGDCYVRSFYAQVGGQRGINARCTINREITARILLWYIVDGDGVWQGQGSHPQEAQLLKTF